MLAPHMEGTKLTLNNHLGTLNLASTHVTIIAKATSTNRPKLGPIEASGGAPHHGWAGSSPFLVGELL